MGWPEPIRKEPLFWLETNPPKESESCVFSQPPEVASECNCVTPPVVREDHESKAILGGSKLDVLGVSFMKQRYIYHNTHTNIYYIGLYRCLWKYGTLKFQHLMGYHNLPYDFMAIEWVQYAIWG
jgi:hypothetical protein